MSKDTSKDLTLKEREKLGKLFFILGILPLLLFFISRFGNFFEEVFRTEFMRMMFGYNHRFTYAWSHRGAFLATFAVIGGTLLLPISNKKRFVICLLYFVVIGLAYFISIKFDTGISRCSPAAIWCPNF